ncbi:MAG TPA: hypothetical protein VIV35_02545 [Chitinophagaceae bacterium]
MKIGTLFLIVALYGPTELFAQKKDGTRFIENAGERKESLENIYYPENDKMPFREIRVLDKRFDSSKTGYTFDFISNKYSRILLQDSWSSILNNYFKKNLDEEADQSLLIVIKSFWIQPGILDKIQSIKGIKKIEKTTEDRGGSCTVEIDTYVQSNADLQAFIKIDTFFLSLSSLSYQSNIPEFLFLPFDSLAKKIKTTPLPELLVKRRKLSWTEVMHYYDQRFNLPVLREESMKKGIYQNFEDFRQNNPLVTEFKFKEGKRTDELYIVTNGKEEILQSYWGFFDGEDLYIHSGWNTFKAIRQQNAFELFGSLYISNYYNDPLVVELIKNRLDKKIFQVNMDTGKLY